MFIVIGKILLTKWKKYNIVKLQNYFMDNLWDSSNALMVILNIFFRGTCANLYRFLKQSHNLAMDMVHDSSYSYGSTKNKLIDLIKNEYET